MQATGQASTQSATPSQTSVAIEKATVYPSKVFRSVINLSQSLADFSAKSRFRTGLPAASQAALGAIGRRLAYAEAIASTSS